MQKEMLTASEAARALGISLDTLRRWDRAGRIKTQRDDANRRLVSVREVERLKGAESRDVSARNRFHGVVQRGEDRRSAGAGGARRDRADADPRDHHSRGRG